jgi:hypothetical protein
MTAGVDSNTILVYTQELVPPDARRQTLYAELNFVNLGGVALATLANIMGALGPTAHRVATSILPAALAATSYALRQSLPESHRWTAERENRQRRPPLPPYFAVRLLVAILFSFSNTSGFSLMTYALGTEFFPLHFHHIMLISTITAFAVGLLARWLGRIRAKNILLVGYALTLLSAWSLARVRTPRHSGFWLTIFTLSAFTSVTYLAEDTFKVDAWPSYLRGRLVAMVRMVSLLLYVTLIIVLGRANLNQFFTTMVLAWGVGLTGAVIWWITETVLLEHQRGVPMSRIVRRGHRRSKVRP